MQEGVTGSMGTEDPTRVLEGSLQGSTDPNPPVPFLHLNSKTPNSLAPFLSFFSCQSSNRKCFWTMHLVEWWQDYPNQACIPHLLGHFWYVLGPQTPRCAFNTNLVLFSVECRKQMDVNVVCRIHLNVSTRLQSHSFCS